MAFLNVRNAIVAIFWLSSVTACRSAPPTDLADPNGGDTSSGRVGEDDLVYTDNTAPLPDPDKDFGTVRTNVGGRSLPGREGRVILKLRKGEKVKVLKTSRDKRWVAVMSLSARKRVWLPIPAVRMPKTEQAPVPPPPPMNDPMAMPPPSAAPPAATPAPPPPPY